MHADKLVAGMCVCEGGGDVRICVFTLKGSDCSIWCVHDGEITAESQPSKSNLFCISE